MENSQANPPQNEPLFIRGGVEGEPVKYLGVKPYEMDKYEFSVLRRSFENKSIWFNASIGATCGFVFLILAKIIQLAISQKPISIEYYEIVAVVIGGLVSYFLRKPKVSEEESEKMELIGDISNWFEQNPNRNIHVSPRKGATK